MAVSLYCTMPFGKMHGRNKEIIEFAKLIGRTPGAVARKLGNFASFDPSLKVRGVGGLPNTSKLDEEVWNEFYSNWDEAIMESGKILAKKQHTTIDQLIFKKEELKEHETESLRQISVRLYQSLFRKMVIGIYNSRCCITGITNEKLLIASHIMPWSINPNNRLNPMNGLALNALHDKAFDTGLLTIDAETYRVKLSSELKKKPTQVMEQNFLRYEEKEIMLPDKLLPGKNFLKWHNEEVFRKNVL